MSERRLKRGDVREDGMVFWSYHKTCKNGERWVSKKAFSWMQDTHNAWGRANKDKVNAANRRRYAANPEESRLLRRTIRDARKEKITERRKAAGANYTRLKCGDAREDGMLFWCYNYGCKNGERWVTPEKFSELKKKNRERNKTAYRSNPEKHRADLRTRRKKNPLRFKEYYATNRARNLDKARAYDRARYAKDPAGRREHIDRWRVNNPEKCREMSAIQDAKRRARDKAASVETSKHGKSIIRTIYKARKRVSDCTGIKFHVDHIIPIARGGPHIPSNLQILPWRVNVSKGAKLIAA